MDIYFSIVIPLYNKRKYISRAIDSILSQTYQYFEIIVVNDGSNDGSELEVAYYAKKNANITLINQENCGVSVARNNGVLVAQYDYICFLDADDEWKPFFLEEISSLIKLFPGKDVYSTRHVIIEHQGVTIYPKAHKQENFRGIIDNFIRYYKTSDGLIHSSSVCLRKPLFLKLGGFPAGQGQGEDVYLWILYSLHTDIVFSNRICTKYYRNTENRSCERMPVNKLPFQFTYFYSLMQSSELKGTNLDRNRNDLLMYLRKNALLHIAGLRINNNTKMAFSHTMMLGKHDKIASLLCYIILLVPNKLLIQVKNIRNGARDHTSTL